MIGLVGHDSNDVLYVKRLLHSALSSPSLLGNFLFNIPVTSSYVVLMMNKPGCLVIIAGIMLLVFD